MFKVICFILVIFTTICFRAQTLPPLPIDSLKKIELQYSDTLIKPFRIDTLYLNLFGGNIFTGRLFFLQPIKKQCLLNATIEGTKNYDYSNYLYGNGKINFGWLSKSFWHEFDIQAFWKKRNQRYYEQLTLSYNPIWFISNGTLTVNNQLRGTKYIDYESNVFLAAQSNWNFNLPSPLGIIDGKTMILTQSPRQVNNKYWTTAAVTLADLITLGDNFYIQPGIGYNIEKKQIESKATVGILINEVKTFLNFTHNSTKPFYFDTLYNNVFPLLVSDNIGYPICAWQVGFKASWRDLQVSANYQRYRSYIGYSPRDSWIIPQLIEGLYTTFNFNVENTWHFLKNNFYLNYTPDVINLIPQYTISDSIIINWGRFDFVEDVFLSGNRAWYNQTLKDFLILSSAIGFNWKSFRFFVGIENVFDVRFEILPARFALGRKYFVGLEYYSKNKSRVK